MARGQFVNTDATPQNFLAIWNRIRELGVDLAAAQGTITKQRQEIDRLQQQLQQTTQTAQQVAIAAGKATSATTTTNTSSGPGPSGGGGNSTTHANFLTLVQQAKADLITEGVSLVGPCGGFEITKRTAQYIAPSDPTVGLLDKPTGNNCVGYAVDIICFNDGIIIDILSDAGGTNGPQWNFAGTVPTSRYRPPI